MQNILDIDASVEWLEGAEEDRQQLPAQLRKFFHRVALTSGEGGEIPSQIFERLQPGSYCVYGPADRRYYLVRGPRGAAFMARAFGFHFNVKPSLAQQLLREKGFRPQSITVEAHTR